MNQIELWNKYISEFCYTEIQTETAKLSANLLFLKMLKELYENEIDNWFRAIEILGYNYYNGHSIKVAHDSMYFNFKEGSIFFCISYSDEHVATYKYNTDYIVKEYSMITKQANLEQYEESMNLIRKIILSTAGI